MPSRDSTIARSAIVLLLTAWLAPAAVAASPIVPIVWSAEGRFVHKAQIGAGKFVELCGPLAAGESIRWSFEAHAAVDFNIHYHVGKDVVFPYKQAQVAAGRETLVVSVAQDYCWMWANKGQATVELAVDLRR